MRESMQHQIRERGGGSFSHACSVVSSTKLVAAQCIKGQKKKKGEKKGVESQHQQHLIVLG
jgi:hypothetical protein